MLYGSRAREENSCRWENDSSSGEVFYFSEFGVQQALCVLHFGLIFRLRVICCKEVRVKKIMVKSMG